MLPLSLIREGFIVSNTILCSPTTSDWWGSPEARPTLHMLIPILVYGPNNIQYP